MALERGPASMVVPVAASYALTVALTAATVLSAEIMPLGGIGMMLIIGAVLLGRKAQAE